MTTRYTLLLILKVIIASFTLLPTAITLAREEPGILFPPDQVAVTTAEIRTIGLSQSDEGSVTLHLKGAVGEQSFTVPVVNSAFNQIVKLSPGTNTLTLTQGSTTSTRTIFLTTAESGKPPKEYEPLYLHSKNELTSPCAECHVLGQKSSDYTVISEKLSCIKQGCHDTLTSKKYKHGPFNKGLCVECHNPHGTKFKKFLKEKRPELCFACHSEDAGMLNSGKIVHFPVKQGECLVCHDPHQSNMPFHLKSETMSELCNNCHNKSMVKFKFMHEPFESGDCNACHSPHVSDFKGLLVQSGSVLCLNCHKEREEEFKRKYVHEPAKKDCHLCHDQHGSDTAAHLRTPTDKEGKRIHFDQPLKELCLSCHRKLDPEVTKQIQQAKISHKPVAEGKCTLCHTPHSTNFKKQLNTSMQEACFNCHEPMKKLIQSSKFQHGPVRTDDCGQCHLVHGSDHKSLLRSNFTENYSENFDVKHYELCFNCHNSKVYIEQRNLETGFRNGSMNLHFLHVNRAKDGRSCMTCHDIHASNQPKHIRTEIPFKNKFTITLEYTKSDSGGGCVVGCHNPRKYDRKQPINEQQ